MAALLVAAAFASLLGACGDETPSPREPTPAPAGARSGAAGESGGSVGGAPTGEGATAAARQAVGGLVQARIAAFAAGRARAYAATAAGAQRRRDTADARRARGLALRGVRLERLAIRVERGRATARVISSYGLARVRGRWAVEQRLRLRAHTGKWRVVGARTQAPRPLWELARYRRMRTRHFVVLVPAGVDPDSAQLTGVLERARTTIAQRLPGRPVRSYPVVIARDAADMAAMTRGIRGIAQLSAITDVSVRTTGPARRVSSVVGSRILVPWRSFAGLPPATRQRVITHELAHAVLASMTSGRAPAWLQEGIALYASGDRRTDIAAAHARPSGLLASPGRRLVRLSRPDAMAALTGDALSAAYALSSSVAYHVADAHGPDRLLALLSAFGDESLDGRPGRVLADRVTRRVLGIGLRRLERDTVEWVRTGA